MHNGFHFSPTLKIKTFQHLLIVVEVYRVNIALSVKYIVNVEQLISIKYYVATKGLSLGSA